MLLSFNSYHILRGTPPPPELNLAAFAMTFFAYRLSAHRPLVTSVFPFLKFEAQIPLSELGVATGILFFGIVGAGIHLQGILPFTALLTVLYFLRWKVGNRELPGLRGIPGVKNVVLALAWALITVGFTSGIHVQNRTWELLFIHRFLLILLLGIGVDLRDLRADRRSGIETLPILYGYAVVRRGLLFISLAATIFYLIQPAVPGELLFPPFAFTALAIFFLRPEDRPLRFTVLLDGILLLTGVAEYLFSLRVPVH